MLGEMLDVCLMSLSHADPGVTQEALEDDLALADAAEMFAHVVRVSTKPRG
jgi:hypothetical protein